MIRDAEQLIEYAGNCVIYYLQEAGPQGLLNGPDRAFVSEELMLIPDNTELLPDYVQEW